MDLHQKKELEKCRFGFKQDRLNNCDVYYHTVMVIKVLIKELEEIAMII